MSQQHWKLATRRLVEILEVSDYAVFPVYEPKEDGATLTQVEGVEILEVPKGLLTPKAVRVWAWEQRESMPEKDIALYGVIEGGNYLIGVAHMGEFDGEGENVIDLRKAAQL